MVNSNQKGKRVEREFRDILRSYGWEARRGQQFSGGDDSPDVVCEELPIHWEVKGDQSVTSVKLMAAIEQAITDCPKGKWRVVAHKKDGGRWDSKRWYATLTIEDFLDIIKEVMELKKL